jgi:hypothetical protein
MSERRAEIVRAGVSGMQISQMDAFVSVEGASSGARDTTPNLFADLITQT